MGATGPLDQARLVIVGGTYFADADGDNAVRILCIYEMLDRLRAINRSWTERQNYQADAYPVIIADASPGAMHDRLRLAFEERGAVVLDGRERPGIATQNQLAIGHALAQGAQRIVRTELEKSGLADDEVLRVIFRRMTTIDPDILSIGRLPRAGGFYSLPPEQQDSERIMSRAIASLGLPEDSACGLRAMNRTGAELIMKFEAGTLGNQWQFLWFTLIDAIVANLVVDDVFVELMHPAAITRLETGNPAYIEKRANQAAQLIPAIVAYGISHGLVPIWDPTRVWTI